MNELCLKSIWIITMDNLISDTSKSGSSYKYVGNGVAYQFQSNGSISIRHLDTANDICEIVIEIDDNIIVRRNPLTMAKIIVCRKCGLTGFISQDLWIAGINNE